MVHRVEPYISLPHPTKRKRVYCSSDEESDQARTSAVIFTPSPSPVTTSTRSASSPLRIVHKAKSKKISKHQTYRGTLSPSPTEPVFTCLSGASRYSSDEEESTEDVSTQLRTRSSDTVSDDEAEMAEPAPLTRRAKVKATQTLRGSYNFVSGKPLFPAPVLSQQESETESEFQSDDESDDMEPGSSERGQSHSQDETDHKLEKSMKHYLEKVDAKKAKHIRALWEEGKLDIQFQRNRMCDRCRDDRSARPCVSLPGAASCLLCQLAKRGCTRKGDVRERPTSNGKNQRPLAMSPFASSARETLEPRRDASIEELEDQRPLLEQAAVAQEPVIVQTPALSVLPPPSPSISNAPPTNRVFPDLSMCAEILRKTADLFQKAASRMENLRATPVGAEMYQQRLADEKRAIEDAMAFVPVILASMAGTGPTSTA